MPGKPNYTKDIWPVRGVGRVEVGFEILYYYRKYGSVQNFSLIGFGNKILKQQTNKQT